MRKIDAYGILGLKPDLHEFKNLSDLNFGVNLCKFKSFLFNFNYCIRSI